MRFAGNVIVLDEHDGELFAVVSDQGKSSAELVALGHDGSVRWASGFEADSHGAGANEPDEAGWEWSTWPTTESIYLSAGVRHEWWAVRAFDRETGEEPFVPETTHDTPEEPLTSVVYRVDRDSGDATRLGERNGVRGATAAGDDAFVLTVEGLSAFDLGGERGVRWERPLSGEGFDVFTDGDRVVSIARNGERSEIAGFHPAGDRRWNRDAPASHGSDTLFVDDTLYVGGGEGVVAVRTDGTVAWRDSRPAGWFIHDDATGRVYTRSGRAADAAAAYSPNGNWLWTFDPPTTVTDDAVLATAITGDHADEPFYTVYSVDPVDGTGSALAELDTIFSVESVGNRAYLAAGHRIHAYEPSPGS